MNNDLKGNTKDAALADDAFMCWSVDKFAIGGKFNDWEHVEGNTDFAVCRYVWGEAAAALRARTMPDSSSVGDVRTHTITPSLIVDYGRVQHENEKLRVAYAALQKNAASFFGWFNKHYPSPSNHHEHPWNRIGLALIDAEKVQP